MKKNIIAISREFGSGGRTIGRLVAQKLGIQFYDRDIIKKVVEESGLDEDSNSPLVQLWKTREKVIKDFATAKPCVIVGSCADYILRDREDCLKVFLYADEETKENRIQEIYGEAGLKLKNRVKDMDVRRGLNYKYFTGQDWGKAQNYDLALNRGSLGIEKCAQLIVDAASEE